MKSKTCTGCKVDPCGCDEKMAVEEHRRTGLQQIGETPKTSEQQQSDDLDEIKKGIKRVGELLEMRCESHGELWRESKRMVLAVENALMGLSSLGGSVMNATSNSKRLAIHNEQRTIALIAARAVDELRALLKDQAGTWKGLDEEERKEEKSERQLGVNGSW